MTREELKKKVAEIRDEKTEYANTAQRVGAALLDIINDAIDTQDVSPASPVLNAPIKQIVKNGVKMAPETNSDAVKMKGLDVPMSKMVTEINVSELFPNGSLGGSNKYTFQDAITKIPSQYRNLAIKCAFYGTDGKSYVYEYQGGTYTDKANWLRVDGEAVNEQKLAVEGVKNQAILDIRNEFGAQRVTPDMLSESTKQLINASGGGTITNLPDDEDLTSVGGVLKLADKEHNPAAYIGMGRKILRKHIVQGKNVLTQEMINKTNTIYIVRYDFSLENAIINIPSGCVLLFEGGSLRNGRISGGPVTLKGDIKLYCTPENIEFKNTKLDINWFGEGRNNPDFDFSDIFNALINVTAKSRGKSFNCIYVPAGDYYFKKTLIAEANIGDRECRIIGDGIYRSRLKYNGQATKYFLRSGKSFKAKYGTIFYVSKISFDGNYLCDNVFFAPRASLSKFEYVGFFNGIKTGFYTAESFIMDMLYCESQCRQYNKGYTYYGFFFGSSCNALTLVGLWAETCEVGISIQNGLNINIYGGTIEGIIHTGIYIGSGVKISIDGVYFEDVGERIVNGNSPGLRMNFVQYVNEDGTNEFTKLAATRIQADIILGNRAMWYERSINEHSFNPEIFNGDAVFKKVNGKSLESSSVTISNCSSSRRNRDKRPDYENCSAFVFTYRSDVALRDNVLTEFDLDSVNSPKSNMLLVAGFNNKLNANGISMFGNIYNYYLLNHSENANIPRYINIAHYDVRNVNGLSTMPLTNFFRNKFVLDNIDYTDCKDTLYKTCNNIDKNNLFTPLVKISPDIDGNIDILFKIPVSYKTEDILYCMLQIIGENGKTLNFCINNDISITCETSNRKDLYYGIYRAKYGYDLVYVNVYGSGFTRDLFISNPRLSINGEPSQLGLLNDTKIYMPCLPEVKSEIFIVGSDALIESIYTDGYFTNEVGDNKGTVLSERNTGMLSDDVSLITLNNTCSQIGQVDKPCAGIIVDLYRVTTKIISLSLVDSYVTGLNSGALDKIEYINLRDCKYEAPLNTKKLTHKELTYVACSSPGILEGSIDNLPSHIREIIVYKCEKLTGELNAWLEKIKLERKSGSLILRGFSTTNVTLNGQIINKDVTITFSSEGYVIV